MTLIRALKPACIQANLRIDSAEALLREIAALGKKAPELSAIDENRIFKALSEREELGSTAFGGGIAIPHCRLPDVEDFVVGIITLSEGVNFNAMDDAPVRLAVFIIAPDTESDEHIRILSGISQALSIPGAVDELLAQNDNEALRESFLRYVRDKANEDEDTGKNLVHVFLQNEDLFRDILQVFGSIEAASALVVEAENTNAYLSKMPLFAGFWSDNPHTFSRLIVATVGKSMTNETIRRIDRIAGGISNRDDLLVCVQDLFYCAGQLGA
jgi:PTS system nitrogen regulatory IIA component